jgi:hypothetical protein
MARGRAFIWVLVACSLSACSSRPREFAPSLAATPEDQSRFADDYERCRVMVAQGQRSGFGSRLASGTVGVASGVGVGAAMAGGTYGTVAGAATAAAATLVLMPVVGVLGAWGLAKAKKSKKEREVKEALGTCLSENGYQVAGWTPDKTQKPIKLPKQGAAQTPGT